MKMKLIAAVLLLATLLGCFGCAAVDGSAPFASEAAQPNFIGNSQALSDGAQKPENLLNFGSTDADGKALYQIVYPVGSADWLVTECENLAEEIRKVTGVKLPVVNSLDKTRACEILIGDVARVEILDIRDQFALKGEQMLMKVIDQRLLIFSRNSLALMSGMSYFLNTASYRNAGTKEFGIAADYEYLHQVGGEETAELLQYNDTYVEFSITNTLLQTTYVRVSFTGNAGWRIQAKRNATEEYNDFGAAQRLSYSLGEADPSHLEKITATAVDSLCVAEAADGSRAEIDFKEFSMKFYTPSGKLASTVTEISSNVFGSTVAGVLEEDEAIFGTGERFNAANQRGKVIEMFSADIWSRADACYMVIPLLCSSRGSGIYLNHYEQMTLDLGRDNKDQWKASIFCSDLDFYVYTTEQIADVIYGYSDLTGYAGLPEEWTYGMIVCAYSPDLSKKWTGMITPSDDGRGEGIYEMIANMEKYDLPWTGVLAEAYPAYNAAWQKDLKELCDYVHALGKKFIVYMAVGNVGSGMTIDAELSDTEFSRWSNDFFVYQDLGDGAKDFRLPQTKGADNNPDNNGSGRVYLDITNPDAVKWYFDCYWEYIMSDVGVDGCKIDFCEQIPENKKLLYYDQTMPTAGSHHWYPTAFCTMFWNLLSSKPDSGMCYTRGGGIGSQRAPYMWAGDQARGYSSLAWQLTAVLSSGLSGVPYMSYDMSGYQYGGFSTNIAYESQVFLRGTQFTAFTICMQTHGKVRRSYQFAEEDPSYLYVTEIYRAYTKLHEHLTPYITELCEKASATGMPVMRHLILGWQDDQNVYGIEDEYTLGDAFLIAPILNDGYSRNIYLPEGKWIDLNTGEEYTVGKSGQWLNGYEANLAELPTFYNVNTESKIAPTLVDGIMELYDYAREQLSK